MADAPLPAPETPAPSEANMPAPDTTGPSPSPSTPVSFADDLRFLEQHAQVITLRAPEGGVVAVSPTYQGRVMTSAVASDAPSLGFVNRAFISAGKSGTQFDNYGGEDRFWLGPEGGQFALYFPPGKPFEFSHWQTPNAFQQGSWAVTQRSEQEVVFTHSMQLSNYSGTRFELEVRRSVRLLGLADVAGLLGDPGLDLSALEWVAFETENQITNTGANAWTEQSGAPSIWILAMYNPSPDTWAILPYQPGGTGPIVNDAYFGAVPSDRLTLAADSTVRFKCDGEHRSKIGLGPGRAKSFAGSYSQLGRLLTLVHTDLPPGETRYVNSMWELQKEPFGGDVINSYNDGPVEPGKPALGGFYELETSSPAAFLAPGASLTHTHRTLHLVGDHPALAALAARALGAQL